MSEGIGTFLVIVFIVAVYSVGAGIDHLVGHEGWGDIFIGVTALIAVVSAFYLLTGKRK